jgi:hypothetical protein
MRRVGIQWWIYRDLVTQVVLHNQPFRLADGVEPSLEKAKAWVRMDSKP